MTEELRTLFIVRKHSVCVDNNKLIQQHTKLLRMFGIFYIYQALYAERDLMRNAQKQPIYKNLVDQAEEGISRICYDRIQETCVYVLKLRPCMDTRLAHQLVKKAVSSKDVNMGCIIRVDLDVKKRVITCFIS
jgi:hypothetical protein